MSKTTTHYVCQQCGRTSPRMLGRCPSCGSWDSMVEVLLAPSSVAEGSASRGLSGRSQPQRLADIEGDAEQRLPLPIGEFARVLGGGVVPGSIVLVGGDPGIGKSTLMLQMAV
ncbi:MAG: DNA repair protein RadA, partial [Anaerolineaceae bacterium]|nr:DNA repair protein RadA [Anaerolineaceae bacterium]